MTRPEADLIPPLVYSERYIFEWPGHVFPTTKYRDLATRLLEKGLVREFVEPAPATDADLLACHRPHYLRHLEAIADGREPQDPRFECPVTRPVLDAFRLAAGGTILAARLALKQGFAANLCGGFHHAYPDHGEGFCLLNDVPVAAHAMKRQGRLWSALVVDLDVHQGNGTAVMTRDDPWIFTVSLHQENNYPPKETSSLDVGLPDGCGDVEYAERLIEAFRTVTERFPSPDLLFYLAGADPFVNDRLGGLDLSKDGLAARDRIVFDWARVHEVPVVVLLAGGYAQRYEDVVDIHYRTIEELIRRWEMP